MRELDGSMRPRGIEGIAFGPRGDDIPGHPVAALFPYHGAWRPIIEREGNGWPGEGITEKWTTHWVDHLICMAWAT